ncbi:hypothetical protein GCM10010353_17320 [Streptomyces chryseus]|nr:hypothetical protein GCM10010353_17320 [Streptomyces chryseus]
MIRSADTVARAYDWRDDALCAQTDPEIFHPEKGQSVRAPKAVCAGCDVRRECLEHALVAAPFGIWGGKTPRERRALVRRRRAAS